MMESGFAPMVDDRSPNTQQGFVHSGSGPASCHPYLVPALLDELDRICPFNPKSARIFDLGCGTGYVADILEKRGYRVTGVDPSSSAIALCRSAYPNLDLHPGSAYDDLAARFGQFDTVISLEVVEHLYDPRSYARTLYSLVRPGGTALVSTPFHGYWKNLAIALADKTDEHLDPLWDHGHIKFWSERTLTRLMTEHGFVVRCIRRVGRIPPFAKSMLAVLAKPAASDKA